MDKFWTSDPYILVKDYYEIVPTNKMPRIKQSIEHICLLEINLPMTKLSLYI